MSDGSPEHPIGGVGFYKIPVDAAGGLAPEPPGKTILKQKTFTEEEDMHIPEERIEPKLPKRPGEVLFAVQSRGEDIVVGEMGTLFTKFGVFPEGLIEYHVKPVRERKSVKLGSFESKYKLGNEAFLQYLLLLTKFWGEVNKRGLDRNIIRAMNQAEREVRTDELQNQTREEAVDRRMREILYRETLLRNDQNTARGGQALPRMIPPQR